MIFAFSFETIGRTLMFSFAMHSTAFSNKVQYMIVSYYVYIYIK